MSDWTFSATRTGFRKLRAVLREADEDTRMSFGFWCFGLATTAAAICLQFGWPGAAFCFGFVVWKTSFGFNP